MKKSEISQETRLALAHSLKKFMAQKPFDKITVRDLLEDCNISCGTFYYHFEDLYSLMQWMFQNEALSLLEKSESCLTWEDGLLLLMRYITKNDKVCLCAYHSIGRDELYRYFASSMKGTLKKFIAFLPENASARKEDIDFITEFYTGAFVSTLIRWLLKSKRESPEKMLKKLDVAVHGSIRAALQRSAGQ